ncbi:type II toxin-antitoxin system RelE/ParE family toxin [Geminocystis sp. GBBB08]|uniref:type II toxin-antitoxin system RelE family toxin n=1 Tax=Geminocystis sp. GBBB08 TaxID=2604140 RepID=UPI0027E220B2|nr:type II toxin-antitoxin system RelE/ParE family toxin [Geminocystis sp. GBBB08]
MYKIEFNQKVKKDLKNIPTVIVKKIKEEIAKLADNPYPLGHKKLKGNLRNFMRIRVGNYRVIYQIEDWLFLHCNKFNNFTNICQM